MSICYDCVNGYGICTSEIKIRSVEALEKMLDKAPEYKDMIHSYFAECEIQNPTIQDYLNFDQDYGNGLATLLQHVVLEADEIEFVSCRNEDGKQYLLYSPVCPWLMHEDEKALTREKVDEIFSKYTSIVSEEEVVPDYEMVVNYG